jgi:uncharacterized hydrophobic protein (TIGR00271 family)
MQLPLHPLFPVLATIVSLYLPFTLAPTVLLIGVGWLLLGGLYYTTYARQRSLQVRKREATVGDAAVEQPKAMYTALVSVANPNTAPALICAGAMLARAKRGRLLVLRVATLPEQVPQHIQRQEAQKEWQEMLQIAQSVDVGNVPIEVLVRLAQSPIDGILSTAQEERADMILLGWEPDYPHEQFDLGPILDPIVRSAPCDVFVLRGDLPTPLRSILVPTAGSPNTIAAIRLAQELVDQEEGHVVAINLVQEVFTPNTMDDAQQRLQRMIKGLGGSPPIEPRVVATEDVKLGILREAYHFDALMLGASRGGVLDQTIFGGLPVEVARESPRPTLLVKHYEGARRFWIRRAWEALSGPIPHLTQGERTEVYQQMRRAARPGVDFFILIGLAAMIATLGLVQSSPAVIIGAMLVAPLMSPILSLALSIVQGNLPLLRLDAIATTLGVLMAISVSAAVTLLIPSTIVTTEILVRTEPNLLDLLVALASGAAGGYAAGRKEVATALPGVAIAAALVPPLGVVGYGIASGRLDIAGGALLLFTTNLIAIVVAAAFIFLLLGFRPQEARLRGQVRIKLLLSLMALVLITIPLAIFSINSTQQINSQTRAEQVLNAELDAEQTRITDVVVERQGDGFVVNATIYATDEFDYEVWRLERRLSREVGAPVTLRATVLRAMVLPERGDTLLPTPMPRP